MRFLGDNWYAKLGIVVLIGVLCFGGYYAYMAGQNMAIRGKMKNVLTELYRAPTDDAWRKACKQIGVEYDEKYKMNTADMKRFIDWAWNEHEPPIQSANPDR